VVGLSTIQVLLEEKRVLEDDFKELARWRVRIEMDEVDGANQEEPGPDRTK